MNTKIPTEIEIQRAHDILNEVLSNKQIDYGSEKQIEMMAQCKSVLCWILGHDDTFLENMIWLESTLAAQGLTFRPDPNKTFEEFKKEENS